MSHKIIKLVACAASACAMAFAGRAEECQFVNGCGWVYYINEVGEAEIRGVTNQPSGTLKFPSSLGGAPVKNLRLWSFDRKWYNGGSKEYPWWTCDYEGGSDWLFSVTKVVIPSSVTNVSDNAFAYYKEEQWTDVDGKPYIQPESGWKRLASVSLPDSIVRCDAQAFYGTPFYYGKTFGELILSSSGKTLYGIKEMVYEDDMYWMSGDVRIPATVTRLADGSATSWQLHDCRMIFEGARPAVTTQTFSRTWKTCADDGCTILRDETEQIVEVVYYADPNAKGWTWGGTWCGVKTYALDVVPPADRAASSLSLGSTVYSYNQWNGRETGCPFTINDHDLEPNLVLNLQTGNNFLTYENDDGRWFVLPVTGAKSAAEIKPVVAYGSATAEQVKGVSVWTDEQLRARAMPALSTKSEWKLLDNWNDAFYKYAKDTSSVSTRYGWPRALWPKDVAVSGRYWVAVELNQRGALGSHKWSGDYTFKVGLSGTSNWSPVLHVTYSDPNVLTPSQTFRGVTVGGYNFAEFDCDGDWSAETDFAYSNGSLTIDLPEAGTLYLYGDANDPEEDDADCDCIDKKTLKITGANIVADTVLDPWNVEWESEEQWERLSALNANSDIIRIVKVSGKTTLSLQGLLDVYHETDLRRIQFIPNSSKAVAVEAAFGSMITTDANGYYGEGYLQGKVTGTGVYKSGETVKLVATPGSGEAFDGWELLCGTLPKGTDLTSATLSFKVTDSIATTAAQKTRKQIVVRAKWRPKYGVYGFPAVIGSGTVSGSGLRYAGKAATLTATPASGYSFVKWSDGVTTASRTVKAVAAPVPRVLYAVFSKPTAADVFPELPTGGYTLTAGVGLGSDDCFLGTASGWTVTATGLPDGMLYNAGKRKFVGVPKEPGTYTVTLKAVKGGTTVTTKVKVVVPAPPVTLVGTFMGFASADAAWIDEHYLGDPSCFGTMPSAMLYPFRMTVAESGSISATMGTTAFTADRWTSVNFGIYSATLKSAAGAKMSVAVEPLAGWVNVTSWGEYATKKATISLFGYRNPYKKNGTAWENKKAGAVVEKLTKLGTCKLAVKKVKNGFFNLTKTTAKSPALTVKISNKGGAVIAGTLANEAISGSAIVRTQKLEDGTSDYSASAFVTTKSGRKWLIELDFGKGVAPTGKATIVK